MTTRTKTTTKVVRKVRIPRSKIDNRGLPPLQTLIKRAARKAVAKTQETKYVSRLVEDNIKHNSPIGTLDFYRVFPIVRTGADEQSRVGDRISPQTLTLKGTVAINRSDGITQLNSALMVRLVVLQLKAGKSYSSAPAVWTGGMYQRLLKRNDDAGGIENVPFVGNQNELYLPINRDDFDVLGERFIKLVSLEAAGSSVEAAPLNTIAKNFNIKLKCPKTLKYDSATSGDPAAFAPFLCVGYAYMDGNGPDALDTRINVSAQSHLYYKDS